MRCCELESAVLAGKARAAEMVGLAQEGQAQKFEEKIRPLWRLQRDVQCHQGELEFSRFPLFPLSVFCSLVPLVVVVL